MFAHRQSCVDATASGKGLYLPYPISLSNQVNCNSSKSLAVSRPDVSDNNDVSSLYEVQGLDPNDCTPTGRGRAGLRLRGLRHLGLAELRGIYCYVVPVSATFVVKAG